MKKYLITAVSLFLISLSVWAEETKLRVAIFDPIINISAIDNDMKSSIREIITSTIVNSGKYNTVERSLLEKVFQEQAFSNSGVVDESNAVEIGKLTGANKVVISLISSTGSKSRGGKYMFSVKIIDVKTANIDKQKVKLINMNDWLSDVATTTDELVNGTAGAILDSPESLNPQQQLNNLLKSEAAKKKSESAKKNTESEFVLHLEPGYTPADYTHKDNYIEVLLNGDVIGGGTLSEGFDIKIKEKKHKKYKLEIRPTSTSSDGKIDTKSGKTQYNIDTSRQQKFEFMIQAQPKGKWTIYSVRLR